MSRFQALLRSSDILCIQEAHGHAGDLDTLVREAPSHSHWGSFTASPAAGGVLISLRNEFVAGINTFEEIIISPGWCLALRCTGPLVASQFICIHIEPALTFAAKVQLFCDIRDCSAAFAGDSFLLGDFNFVPSDEARFSVADARDIGGDTKLADRFETLFGAFTELHQATYTRKQIGLGMITTLSRLDRIYTNIQPCVLQDLSVHTHAVGYITNPNNVSDHIPVSSTIQPVSRRPPASFRLCTWTVLHPEFAATSRDMLDTCPLHSSGIAGLAILCEILQATDLAIKALGGAEGASTTPQRLYWALMAMRGGRDHRASHVSRAVGAYPKLLDWCSVAPAKVSDPTGLHNHIAELSRTNIDSMRNELEADRSIAEWKKIGRREALRRRATAWSSVRRRVSTFTILDSSGSPASSVAHATQMLSSHWGAVFAAKPCSKAVQNQLLQHVVAAPDDIEWRLPRAEFIAIAERCSDSAPGPDGIPYSAWVRADPRFIDCVYRAYEELLDGAALPHGFNAAHMVFLPKGEYDSDAYGIARLPESTRPLALSNAVAKVLASAFNTSLSQMAGRTVSARQRGFVRGRNLLDNVLETEAAATHFGQYFGDSSGIALLDLAAAFPSLAHSWIFAVLRKMGVPRFFRRALAKLYRQVDITLLFGGTMTAGFTATSGIKQGCPASGSLFALALDPFLRFLCLRLPAPTNIISAFADDIAVVTRSFLQGMAVIAALFRLLERATAMKLNPAKCIFIPLGQQTAASILQHIDTSIPALNGALVQWHGRYLGFMVGPAAEETRWDTAAAKFWSRAMAARDAGGGFFHNILHYSIYATSVLGYLMQFAKLPKRVLQMEARILQYLTHGPWHALPSAALLSLCDLGFPKEPASLRDANCAAMFRAAAGSKSFPEAAALLDLRPTELDAQLAPRTLPWMSKTSIWQLRENFQSVSRQFPLVFAHPLDTVQSRVNAACRAARFSPWGDLLRRRASRWFPERPPAVGEHMFCNIVAACRVLPPRVVFSTLRLIANGVSTARRYQQVPLDCHLCGWVEGDCVEHYIHCEVMLIFSTRYLPRIGWKFGPVFGTLRCMLASELTHDEMVATVVANDLLVTTLAAITQGSTICTPVQHLEARLRALSRSSATIRSACLTDFINFNNAAA